MRAPSSPRRHRSHDTATLPYTKDTCFNTSTDSELYETPRSTERTITTTQDNLRVTDCGNEPPSDGLQGQSHRERSTAYTSYPIQIPHITLPRRNAATSPQTLQQSPTARAHSPPAGPYAPKWTTPPSGALNVCAGSRYLSTGRVSGQPGLARLPSPQDHNPEGDTQGSRAPTPPKSA